MGIIRTKNTSKISNISKCLIYPQEMIRCLLAEIKYGENVDLPGVLIQNNFDEYTEHDKFHILFGRPTKFIGNSSSVLETIIQRDKVECLQTLLPLVPLCGAITDGTHIPVDEAWIQSPAWMRDTLHACTARWNSEVCRFRSVTQSDKEAELSLLKDIAFTILAAELFCCGLHSDNGSGSMQCIIYLLDTAPDLIKVQVLSEDNRLPLHVALLSGSPITSALVESGATVGDTDAVEVLATIYLECGWSDYVYLATKILSEGNEEQIRQYRLPDSYESGHYCSQSDGSSLLHMVCFNQNYTPRREKPQIVECMELLLTFKVLNF